MSQPRSMPLGALTDVIEPERVIGLPVGEVRGLAYDSRAVGQGTLFFAVPGVHVDGHEFVAQAVERGALAVVVERELPGVSVPQLVVDRARNALADAADAWFGQPSRSLHVVGVTGTDGKTTTCFLAAAMLQAAGMRPGLIGTVELGIGDSRTPNENRNTTPEAPELQALLADMVAAGNDAVVMEATSHGLAQARTRNVDFDVGILTNLTSEHLEFHGSLENYRAAKAMLFEAAPVSILNADDPSCAYFRGHAAGSVVTYGLEADADLRASAVDATATGTAFDVTAAGWSGRVALRLPGSFNVHNALAVMALAQVEGIELELAARALGEVPGVPGRMETVDEGQPFGVVVDYAHTADSLSKVLRILRPLASGRVIAVFGSAGERDPTKRPAMGRVAAELADVTVVTDEDPRLEDPRAINEAIADGARAAGARDGDTLYVIDDRTAAIRHAIGLAREGDVILLAGKGHEKTIIYGTEGRAWDEKDVARRALRDAGYGSRG
ncbi:MAG TPA: UDP-N-acetylmuramoyl-L-alanyl-D-glutamate--2,6-diaminopimelate ligase [Candidatus Limnocylindria bacterium]|jgi:UDP-N-acetylmuramoyl-L-alanyl-D-glutamate--2,6-diaminopimelate ligase|nr:UDP-N-acetylmuramoyl-L-alanyl-D-glutamate--2,6-diaminopimelate ligase [Candidatus Limnocylindria bacterium]